MGKELKYYLIIFLLSIIIGFMIAKLFPHILSNNRSSIENTKGEKKDVRGF